MIVGKKSAVRGLPRIPLIGHHCRGGMYLECAAKPWRREISVAQGYGRPPGDIGEPGDAPFAGEQPDSAQLLVRIGRLESQMRQINGQLEQMQFENRRLEEQLKKFQEDVDFRFHDGAPGAPAAKPPQKRSEAPEAETFADAPLAAAGCRRAARGRPRRRLRSVAKSWRPGSAASARQPGSGAEGGRKQRAARRERFVRP